ncbi:hypothetical protein [Enterobacter sp. C2]|uniref:hypothetical protein n=1 Tax=Enterobacter sp. C2 TaxID=2870346 RepID=UPI001CA44560|nr:hypothetical protein [Enterobacter sp. C2]
MIRNLGFFFISCFLLGGCTALNSENQQLTNHPGEMAELQAKRDKQRSDYARSLDDEELKREKYVAEHPEVPAKPLGHNGVDKRFIKVIDATNTLPLVTRVPDTEDSDLVYINMKTYALTFTRIMQSISALGQKCQRASAYSGRDIMEGCIDKLATDLKNFSSALKTTKSYKGKVASVDDATFGAYIDFGHAARLMNMFEKLCRAQGYTGYISLVTVAAPCDDDGQTLSIRAARREGLIR